MLLPRTLSQHGVGAGSLQVPGLCLHTAPTLSHSRKETSQAPFSQHTPTTFSLSDFGCASNTDWEPAPSSPLPVPPWSEQSRACHTPEPCWGTTRVCLSLQALSCVPRHAGPAPSPSPCAAVVPTHSPGFRHWCDRGAWAWTPNHPELQGQPGEKLLERALGAAFPRDVLLHPSRSLLGRDRDRAHAPPSPPSSGCTSGQQMLAQTLAGAGDKGSRYLLPARQSQHCRVQPDLPLARLG